MPSVLLAESVAVELGAMQPWPDDVTLYQPNSENQLLLPDEASSLSVQAFLKMCSLPFGVEMRENAEAMSPSGQIPFIRCGAFVVAEMDTIVAFVNRKGIHLSDHLDPSQSADMRAYMSLVNNVLVSAELYVTWHHEETVNAVTKPRYESVFPWPIKHVIFWQKQRAIKRRLSSLLWLDKKLDDVYEEVNSCCQALSERLGQQQYFFGNKATELDALVFGHLHTILNTPLPDTTLSAIVTSYDNLVELCKRIELSYFEPEL